MTCSCANPWAHDQCTEVAGCKIKAKLTTPPAAQRQWVGLTQQERAQVLAALPDVPFEGGWHFALFTAIEAKLREKNGGQA